jgi:excisionase family DNA binding protein
MSGLSINLPPEVLDQLVVLVADELERRRAWAMPPQHSAHRRWLTVDEAAAYIGASRQRIYDLRSNGRLKRTADGSRVLVDRLELDRMVEQGGV